MLLFEIIFSNTLLYVLINIISKRSKYYLIVALEVNSSLSSLEIGRNRIGRKGAEKLAQALTSNEASALARLHLEFNNIGTEGAVALADVLISIAEEIHEEENSKDDINIGSTQTRRFWCSLSG